ncbi:dihydrofolate reductase family protein [Microbacterium sp. H1-D42]|uniref:dihydrofolate reductase family protein n=1 Tax=Microbacterium sp. H1-D42 TaxID=2925844 RepID=UPI001F52C306|nr:dihydrofolate reductase family protein [Microbacterium sp. H1-D42]UNK72059.1 dihydrofolate reductase family protein [Microbacterium sp. H1-D42]
MGRIVVVNFTSLDGVIQSPLFADEDREGGFEHGGWVPPYSDDVVNAFMQQATVSASGMLLGRRSYEILRDAWSDADDAEPAIAAMNNMPKYVAASAPVELTWPNSSVISSDVRGAVGALRERGDGDIVIFGSGGLVRALAEHDLVDEYRLLLFPLVLGRGKRMFDADARFADFSLTDTVVAPSGVVILTYARSRD